MEDDGDFESEANNKLRHALVAAHLKAKQGKEVPKKGKDDLSELIDEGEKTKKDTITKPEGQEADVKELISEGESMLEGLLSNKKR